jgi:hypothetical protein
MPVGWLSFQKTRKRPRVASRRTGQLLGAAPTSHCHLPGRSVERSGPECHPEGCHPDATPEDPSTSGPVSSSTTDPRRDPGPPCRSPPDGVERPGRPGTPVPAHHQVSSGARRRRSDLRWSGTGGCLVRPVRLVTRRLLVVPPDLDTPVPVAEPLVPFPKERASVVAVLPEHDLGASPESHSSVRYRSLSSCAFWWIGSIRFRIPVPCSAWTHDDLREPGDQREADLSTVTSTISPAHE